MRVQDADHLHLASARIQACAGCNHLFPCQHQALTGRSERQRLAAELGTSHAIAEGQLHRCCEGHS